MYFAEVASKSAQYCFSSKKNPTGILLLNEVSLGRQLKLFKANYSAKKACQRAGLDSVKGVGRHGPSELTAQQLPDGVRVCMGPMTSDADFTHGDLLYAILLQSVMHSRHTAQVLGARHLRCCSLPFTIFAAGEIYLQRLEPQTCACKSQLGHSVPSLPSLSQLGHSVPSLPSLRLAKRHGAVVAKLVARARPSADFMYETVATLADANFTISFSTDDANIRIRCIAAAAIVVCRTAI